MYIDSRVVMFEMFVALGSRSMGIEGMEKEWPRGSIYIGYLKRYTIFKWEHPYKKIYALHWCMCLRHGIIGTLRVAQ